MSNPIAAQLRAIATRLRRAEVSPWNAASDLSELADWIEGEDLARAVPEHVEAEQ